MIIVDYIKGFLRVTKGKQLEKLNKSIDLMTLDEISYELISKLVKINKFDEVDDRTEKLINKLLEAGSEKRRNDRFLALLFSLRSNELKLDFLEKFSPKMSETLLYDALNDKNCGILEKSVNEDPKARREDRINRIKIGINDITSRLVKREIKNDNADGGAYRPRLKRYEYPLEMKLSTKERDRLAEENDEFRKIAIPKIFLRNYERLNIYEFFNEPFTEYSIIEEICNELPKEEQEIFFLEYVKSVERKSYKPKEEMEVLRKELLERVSADKIKFTIIENMGIIDDFYSELLEKVEITKEDIRNYYRETGKTEIFNIDSFREIANIETAEELVGELQYFEGKNRKHFFDILQRRLNEDERQKLLDNDEIEEELKESIYNFEESINYFNSNKEKQLDICNRFLENSSNEKLKNTYRIIIADINGDNDEIVKIIKSGNFIYNYQVARTLYNLSDDELKELYAETDNDQLRSDILQSRKKTDSWRSKNYRIVNQDNYIDYLKNVISEKELNTLLNYDFRDYLDKLTYEQLREVYDELLNRDLLKSDSRLDAKAECIRTIETAILKNASIEECVNLSNSNFPKEDIYNALKNKLYNGNDNFDDRDTIKKFLLLITNTKDIKAKDIITDIISEARIRFLLWGTPAEDDKDNRKGTIKALYEQLMDSEDIDISNKYYFLSKYMSICYDETREKGKKADYENFIKVIEPKFRKINELAGRSEYGEMFDFSPEYVQFYKDQKPVNVTNYTNMIDCIKYLASDRVHDKLVELYKENHGVMQNISPSLLEEDVIELLDDDIMDFISRYGVDASGFKEVLKDNEKTELFFKAYDRLRTIKTYSEEDSLKIASTIEKLNIEDYMQDGVVDEKSIDLLIAFSLSDKLKGKYFATRPKEGKNKHETIVEQIKEKSRAEIKSKLLTRKQALDAIGMRFLGLSYEQMSKMGEIYAEDVEILINKYTEKAKEKEKQNEKLSLEEQNELTALRTLRNIKEILSIKDTKALAETFEELDKLEEFKDINFALSNALEDNVKRAYAKDYKEKVYSVNEADRLEKDVDGIKVYSPTEFNMLVHVVAAYGNFELIDKKHPEKSSKEIWKNVDNKQNHILCTSYIGNSNLCFKRKMEDDKDEGAKVIFGFSNFSENGILMAAPYDIGSDTTSIKSDNSAITSSFRTGENMIKQTRWLHNEVCVERRLENQKNANIEPDYIVCVDEINEESKKVAKDFGIPIVFLETKKIAKQESEKINKLFEDFNKTKNPEIISEIINLYGGNLNTYTNYRSEYVEKYFNPSKMTERIKKMMSDIDVQYKMGDKENAINCYQALYESLQKEINYYIKLDLEPEEGIKKEFKIRELKELSKSIYERIKNESGITSNRKKKEKSREEGIAYEVISKVKERNTHSER